MTVIGCDLYHGNAVPPNVVDLDFVFHKATQGVDYRDPSYPARVITLRPQVPVWGAYHFWASNGAPELQAQTFLDYVRPATGDVLILDFESDGGPGWTDAQAMVNEGNRFIATVRAEAPANRILAYCNENTLTNYVERYGLTGFDGLWVAHPGSPPPPPWLFWQYASDTIDHDYGNFATVADLKAWSLGHAPINPGVHMEWSDTFPNPNDDGSPETDANGVVSAVQASDFLRWTSHHADELVQTLGATQADLANHTTRIDQIQAQIATMQADISAIKTLVSAQIPSKLSGTATVTVNLSPAAGAPAARNDQPAEPV